MLKTKAEKKRGSDVKLFEKILQYLRSQMTKTREDLVSESNISRSKSVLSEEAQKRMNNKLKNQANKLRGAISKAKNVKALGIQGDTDQSDSIREENIPVGYDPLNNQADRLISGLGHDDENQLLEDNTLFQDLDENDPLLV